MATIQLKDGRKNATVDLTPMVDLNLLLITFFMLATSLSTPKVMEIVMPYKKDIVSDITRVKDGASLTILVSEKGQVYYYDGMFDAAQELQTSRNNVKNVNGIRAIIQERQNTIKNLINSGVLHPTDELTVFIKPTDKSSTADVVHVLDEMNINQVPIYMITDITTDEVEWLAKNE